MFADWVVSVFICRMFNCLPALHLSVGCERGGEAQKLCYEYHRLSGMLKRCIFHEMECYLNIKASSPTPTDLTIHEFARSSCIRTFCWFYFVTANNHNSCPSRLLRRVLNVGLMILGSTPLPLRVLPCAIKYRLVTSFISKLFWVIDGVQKSVGTKEAEVRGQDEAR